MNASKVSRRAMPMGSASLSDDEFIMKFENCTYSIERLKHLDHLRLAWLYLKRFPFDLAATRMCRQCKIFICANGDPNKYHHTVTLAWMDLVNTAIYFSPDISDFHQFIRDHQWLLNKDIIFAFYSREVLQSQHARAAWVPPNLRPLPAVTTLNDSESCFLRIR